MRRRRLSPAGAVSLEGFGGEEEALLPVTPLVKTQHDLTVVSPEGWDGRAQFRAGQEYPTVAVT